MSEGIFILLSALLLAAPVGVKYLLAFKTRLLLAEFKSRERRVRQMRVHLEGMERECVVVGRALAQLDKQQRQARVRRALMEDKLHKYSSTVDFPAFASWASP